MSIEVDVTALSEALHTLQQQLGGVFPVQAGVRQLAVPLASVDSNDMLAWLGSQSQYPQFYWHQREGHEQVAACGACTVFHSMAEASAFIQRTAQTDLRVWGLNAFEQAEVAGAPQRAFLFLPRLEWVQRGKQQWLSLNLVSEHSLQEDARQARDYLAALRPPQPLAALQVRALSACHLPEWPQWQALLEQALQSIRAGALEKVVLARCTRLTLDQPLSAVALMAASRQVNHHCYHFMLVFAADQGFLGSSPERLYLRQRQHLLTEALAGTAARAEDPQRAQQQGEWLMQDGKNQHENLLVVDDICQRLQGGATAMDVLPVEVLRLRKVQHLRRVIQAQLLENDDADCLQRLQPTAAVAGLPREQARQFIQVHEPFSRGWYAGSAGYLSLHQSEFAVALRSAQIAAEEVSLYAGAGIVEGSDARQEWHEINNKAAGLLGLLEQGSPVVNRDKRA